MSQKILPILFIIVLLTFAIGIDFKQNQINLDLILTVLKQKFSQIGEINCLENSQCPQGYICQIIQGEATICPDTRYFGNASPQRSCSPTNKIIKGVCKLLKDSRCLTSSDCLSSLICHNFKCIEAVAGDCLEPNDCPKDYKCVQKCGPPAARFGDNPPGYQCLIDELAQKPRMCPICLSSNTLISTPYGEIKVQDLKVGMEVYSLNKYGEKIIAKILKIASTSVTFSHQIIHLTLDDGRQVWVSPDHPTITNLKVRNLVKGEDYSNSFITRIEFVPYWDNKTYDLLPNSETGFYFANGIPLGSTLK